ncbi:MAG: SHOCT domain-containing protein [Thermoleophilia bacterium]|jgi:putative membrane protein
MGIILIVVVIAGVWFIFNQASANGGGLFNTGTRVPVETPLEVLKKRYARGEIDRAEYEQRRADLQ